MAADQGKAEENFGFEFETEGLGRVCCRPLNFKLLFKFTDLIKSAPDTVPDFVCALLSVVGEQRDAAGAEGSRSRRNRRKPSQIKNSSNSQHDSSKPPIGLDQAGRQNRQQKAVKNAHMVRG